MGTNQGNSKPSFITLNEFEEFQRPQRFVPRTIVETPIEPAVANKSDLIGYVKTQLNRLTNADRAWFGCACIQVKEDDGLSWDCEAVNRLIANEFSQLKRWPLTQRADTDELPIIASFVGLRTFLKLAVANKLTDGYAFFTLRSWTRWAALGAALLIGFVTQFFTSFQKVLIGANPTISQIVSSPRFYLVSGALVVLGQVALAITNWQTTGTKSKSVEKLATRLSLSDTTKRPNYDTFVHAVAEHLQTVDFPRAVIIENFEHLDPTTRVVIDLYFQKYSEQRSGSEFWIIFENESGDRFSNLYLQNSSRGSYRHTTLFQQAVLTEQQKLNLVTLLGKSAEAAEYVTVKRVCKARDADSEEVEAFFTKYREIHPRDARKYDELDFFFLLSLTADNISLTQKFILGNLAVKTGLRTDVLNVALRGTKLRIEEFRGVLQRVQQRFKEFLIFDLDGESTKFKVLPERAAVLSAKADSFGLDPGLAHLFWALFWHDKLQQHPIQAVLIRKLARHLLEADASSIRNNQSYINIRLRLFEASLFTIDGCLKACLFKPVLPLLQRATNFLQESELPADDAYQTKLARLLTRCWQVYTVLGDEEVLKLIVDIYDAPGRGVSYHRDSTRLEKMFFESMPLSPEKRRRINPELLEKIYGRTTANHPIADYAQARASWLALSAGPLIDSDVCKFVSAVEEAASNLPKIAKAAFDRMNEASDENVRLTDVITLSLSLWCTGLEFGDGVIARHHAAKLVDHLAVDAQPDPQFDFRLPMMLVTDFSHLLQMAEDAVLLADKLRRPAEESDRVSTDYLLNGLAKELSAISLASTLTAASHLRSIGFPILPAQLAGLNGIIKIINELLGLSFPEVKDPADLDAPQLLSKVDSLLRLCGVIWKHFGLERLSDFINIRRIYFKARCLPKTIETTASQTSMLESLGSSLNAADFAGLLANIAVSQALRRFGKKSAFYVIRAAELALAADFGKPIKDQLALAAIRKSNTYDHDLSVFVRHVVAETPGHKRLLERFLNEVPEANLPGEILIFLNLLRLMKEPADVEKLLASLRQFASSMTDEKSRREVESLFDLYLVREQIRKGEAVDLDALFASWTDRRDLWLYPSVVRLLLQQDYAPSKLKPEILSILASREPELDRFNTYFLLSLAVSEKLGRSYSNGESEIPLSYLQRGIDKWQDSLPPESVLAVYTIFARWDPTNFKYYENQILKWQVEVIESDRLKRLPRLMMNRDFFSVFHYYFEALSLWGLQTSVSPEQFAKQLTSDPDQITNELAAWKQAGAPMHQALLKGNNNEMVVNFDFLSIGTYLFSSSGLADAAYEDARAAYNDHARVSLDDLFETIRRLPGLPAPIRDLMQSHHQMISEYTLPAA